jgi:hypothetical protein
MTQKDNTTLQRKAALRLSLLRRFAPDSPPVVLETHGGLGEIFKRVYTSVARGAVFETDLAKVEVLARQRPTWCVYQAKAEPSLAEGAAAHLPISMLDVDPYGEPWPTIEAFFASERERGPVLVLAVNDGLRQKLRLQGAWHVASMRQAVERWGNGPMHAKYLEVCRWKLEQLAAMQRYRVSHWTGYHCGFNDDMTHYGAVLVRERGPKRVNAGKAKASGDTARRRGRG